PDHDGATYLPLPMRDGQRALRLIRQQLPTATSIGVLGFSAGGHLAASLATMPAAGTAEASDPAERLAASCDFLVAVYPVITMSGEAAHRGSRQRLLGADPAPQLLSRFSLEHQVSASTPPTVVIHGAGDRAVPVANGHALLDALSAQQRPHLGIILDQVAQHGFGLKHDWLPATLTWLKQHGH
ncbi:MAG: alpha/beta hydrolase family protein, partial [Planctomycetota bacterium]